MPTVMHPAAAPPRVRRKPGPKPGEHKALRLAIFPELPTPTGQEVRELRQAMSWTLEQAAGLLGLYDASAMGAVERDAGVLTPQRWTLMLLAAQRHPTLKLVPADTAPSSEQPLS